MYTNSLSHHGILGMKWGIRRYQNPDGSLTDAGKQRYLKSGTHGDFMGQSRDKDIHIKAGKEAYRLQQNKDSKYKDGYTYVTLDPNGHVQYMYSTCTIAGDDMGLFKNTFNNNDVKAYSVKLKTTQDLVMPSYEKSIDAFLRTVQNVGLKEIANDVKYYDYTGKDFINDVKHLKVEECRDRAYENFMRVVTSDNKLKEQFFSDLKSQGYNAIIDDNDHHFGNDSYSRAPVIVFEKSNSLKEKSKRAITSDMLNDIEYAVDYGAIDYGNGLKYLEDKWNKKGMGK